MQSYDGQGKLMETFFGDKESILGHMRDEIEKGRAKIVVGKFPEIGQRVEINGLSFKVFNVTEHRVFLVIEEPVK